MNREVMAAGLCSTGGVQVPLEGVDVQGNIVGRGAAIKLRQRFRNIEKDPIEVVYKFPLPESAAVCGFKAFVGDRVIEGEIEEKDKAFELYDEALSRGHGTQLLDEERPNIFTLSVGGIKPGNSVMIEIAYVILLDAYESEVRFFLPTTISPRYVPDSMQEDHDIPVNDIVNPPFLFDVPYGLTLNITIHGKEGISSVASPSHHINTSFTGDSIHVSLTSEESSMNKDFILNIVQKEAFSSRAFLIEEDGQHFVQIDFTPHKEPLELNAGRQKHGQEIVFVLDCSGSMAGESIKEAKKAMEIMIRALNPGTRFNIYRFGSQYESLFPTSQGFDNTTMNEALAYLARTDASLGGTEVLGPLKDIYVRESYSDFMRDIILITDGEISNEDEVRVLVQEHADKTNFHTVGIGSGPNEFLIKSLVRVANGAFELISTHERIESKVLRLFNKVLVGSIRNLKIEWDGDALTEQAPLHPIAFLDQGTSIFASLKDPCSSIKIYGETGSGRREWIIDCTQVADHDLPTARFWAREKIRDLEERAQGGSGSRQTERSGQKMNDDIIEISKRYGVISRETSFIGVEKRQESEQSTSEIVLRKVPVILTKGWGGLFKAASCYSIQNNVTFNRMAGNAFRAYNIDATPRFSRIHKGDYRKNEAKFSIARRRYPPLLSPEDDDLLEILSNQKAEGGFEENKRLLSKINIAEREIKDITDKIRMVAHGNARAILITMLTLITLEFAFGERKDEWQGLAGKSKVWLQHQVNLYMPTIEQQPLQNWLRDFIQERLRHG